MRNRKRRGWGSGQAALVWLAAYWPNPYLRSGLILAILLLVGSGIVYAQSGNGYDLTWWTIAGGGKTDLTGGDYTLFSTAGQPEADAATLSAGQYSLLSGFWAAQPHTLVNCPAGPAISYTPANPQPGQPVQFTGTLASGNGQITFTWSFGDGQVQFLGQSLAHTYLYNGIYTVILTTSGQNPPCTSPPSTTTNITIGTGVSPYLVYLPLISRPSPIILTSTGNPAISLQIPAQVIGLQGSPDPTGDVTHLAWTAKSLPDSLVGYRVYRRAQGATEPFNLLATLPATLTTYTDDTTACGQSYYVTAFNATGESGASTVSYYSPACPK